MNKLSKNNIFKNLINTEHFIVFSKMKHDTNKIKVKNDVLELCSVIKFENIYLITDPSHFSRELRKPNVLFIFILPIIPKEIAVFTYTYKTYQTSMIFISDTLNYKVLQNADIVLFDEKNPHINSKKIYKFVNGKLHE